MFRIAALVVFLAAPAWADGYADHKGVTIYTTRPCTEVVAAIDAPSSSGVQAMAAAGMAWGFLLGYDTAMGGLQGNEKTTLIRLRKACAESPETTAMELLKGFVD